MTKKTDLRTHPARAEVLAGAFRGEVTLAGCLEKGPAVDAFAAAMMAPLAQAVADRGRHSGESHRGAAGRGDLDEEKTEVLSRHIGSESTPLDDGLRVGAIDPSIASRWRTSSRVSPSGVARQASASTAAPSRRASPFQSSLSRVVRERRAAHCLGRAVSASSQRGIR